MIKKLTVFVLFLLVSFAYAQEYPLVTIHDIQYISTDSLNTPPHDYKSKYDGDTVRVQGVVMNAAYIGTDPNNERFLNAGAPAVIINDPNNREFGGIIVRDPIGSTAFSILDTGLVIEVTGVVSEFYTTTQFNIIEFSASNIIGKQSRPQPVQLTLDSLIEKGTTNPIYTAEKWEGVYCEFKNLSVVGDAIGKNSFFVQDDNKTQMIVYTASNIFRPQKAPNPGTKLEYVRGYIETRVNNVQGGFIINPLYEDDIKYGDVIPPNISNVDRNKAVVKYGDEVEISAKVKDSDGTINSVKLFYSTDNENYTEVAMTAPAGDSIYTATIPAFNDSTFVSYFIEAMDNDAAVSTNPTDTSNSRYFYFVLDRNVNIQEVQYSPFGNGYSGYNNQLVTLHGVVTADTSDIEGDGNTSGAKVYMQNGTGPWSGIQLFGAEALKLKRGNEINVTGIVRESYGVTRLEDINDPSNIEMLNENAQVPEPTKISTKTIGTAQGGTLPAEAYESVLLKYVDVKITDDNADGETGYTRNFGEILVADTSNVITRVELQDGTHYYHNLWDASLEGVDHQLQEGNEIGELIGILYYSYSNYKLVPRKNDDFVNVVTDVNEEVEVPEEYTLYQNYPNPFNPATTIKFFVPEQGKVRLDIYNVLGSKVKTLVNGEVSSGNHQVTFDASNLASGVYFYQLRTKNFVQSKKMVLLK